MTDASRAPMRWTLLLLLAVPASSSAQAPSPNPADRPPTFTTTTRLVQVSVVVHDKDGKPVAGLTADDFQLFEDGKPQVIESFTVQAAGSGPVPPQAPGGGDFSNHIQGPAGGGATVILLDRLNTRFED